MDRFVELCEAYCRYIQSGFAKAECGSLVAALEKAKLPVHAEALNIGAAAAGGGINARGLNGFFGRECAVSREMPKYLARNCCWFDPICLDFFIRTESRVRLDGSGGGVWVGMRPVQIWQYLVFLKLSRVSMRYPGSIEIDDFMKGRFFGEISSNFVVNVYHEEAKAYAAWCGRGLVSQFDMNVASEDLSSDVFDGILPGGLSVWDGAIGREDKRCVISRSDKAGQAGIVVKECDEWFRHPEIGMISCVSESVGVNQNRIADHFYDDYLTVNNHICAL